MDCVHHLFLNDVTPGGSSSTSKDVMWSVAYSFRTVTVV
jgi:hypothetical protein